MVVPHTRYARSGDVCIAYQVVSDGPRDIVLACDPAGSCELLWDDPVAARCLRRLAGVGRLILFDVRGSGASSPMLPGQTPPLQALVDDLLLVLDVVESDRATVLSPNLYAPLAWMFAAAHPERTDAVVGIEPFARLLRDDDHPHGMAPEMLDAFVSGTEGAWGTAENAKRLMPSRAGDQAFVRWCAKAQRLGVAPTTIAALFSLLAHCDVRGTVPSVHVPALLITRNNMLIPPQHSESLVTQLPDAQHIAFDAGDFWWYSADADAIVDHIVRFLTGTSTAPSPPTGRALATVLFTDIVDSTTQAQALGDDEWTSRLSRHDDLVRRHVEAFGGRWIKSTGDGALATFDAPARAVICADELQRALDDVGLEIRSGLHTGEVELIGDDVAGIAVHIAARIAALAGPGEILVSATIPALVAGSSLSFADHGTHQLKGVDGSWGLSRVVGT